MMSTAAARGTHRAFVPLLLIVFLAGCFNPNQVDNPNCSVDGECPSGLECKSDKVCRAPGNETEIDASVPVGDISAELSSLTLSISAPLSPAFAPEQTSYQVDSSLLVGQLTLEATALDPMAMITVGAVTAEGEMSTPIALSSGANSVKVDVVSSTGDMRSYDVRVIRGRLPFGQSLYVKSAVAKLGLRFGHGIAISGDTMVVGVPRDGGGGSGVDPILEGLPATRSGAVYVYRRVGGTWQPEAYIKASNADSRDEFGHSVAVMGNLLVVGAARESSAAVGVNGSQDNNLSEKSGAAYVFRRSAEGTWSQEAYLKASNTNGKDEFGTSISISEDRIAVGAAGEDGSATGVDGSQIPGGTTEKSGAVYLFRRAADGIWSQEAYIKASNTFGSAGFGSQVSLSGDTLAVSAPNESSNATGIDGTQTGSLAFDTGAVYVFRNSISGWSQEAYIKAADARIGDDFGTSMALQGDTLVVGAPGEDSGASGVFAGTGGGAEAEGGGGGSGAVYIFDRLGAQWSQTAYVKSSNTGQDDAFGISLALRSGTLVVGATNEDSASTGLNGDQVDSATVRNGGAVYLFALSGNTWSQEAYIKASNTGELDAFGAGLALGTDSLAIGAIGEDSSATGFSGNQSNNSILSCGAAYVFE